MLLVLLMASFVALRHCGAEETCDEEQQCTKHDVAKLYRNILKKGEDVGSVMKPAVAGSAAPVQYTVKAVKSGGRILNVMDNTAGKATKGMSAIRLDLPHAKANYHHWNVNSLLSGAKDPHASASTLSVYAGKSVNNAALLLQKVGPALAVTTAVIDGVRIGSAAYEDYKAGSNVPENTVKTVAHVAGGYAGGYTGALAGGAFGAKTGGIVGTAFGPAGSLAGAAIGGVAGSVAGAVEMSNAAGSIAQEAAIDAAIWAIDVANDPAIHEGFKQTAEAATKTILEASEAIASAGSKGFDFARDAAIEAISSDTSKQALTTAQETAQTFAALAKDAGTSAAEYAGAMGNAGSQWMASAVSNLKSKL